MGLSFVSAVRRQHIRELPAARNRVGELNRVVCLPIIYKMSSQTRGLLCFWLWLIIIAVYTAYSKLVGSVPLCCIISLTLICHVVQGITTIWGTFFIPFCSLLWHIYIFKDLWYDNSTIQLVFNTLSFTYPMAHIHIGCSKWKYFPWINGLVQETRNSIANALGLRLCHTNPSKCRCYISDIFHRICKDLHFAVVLYSVLVYSCD